MPRSGRGTGHILDHAFYTIATEAGQLRFERVDDNGTVYTAEAEITVV